MKKILLGSLLSITVTTLSFAQEQPMAARPESAPGRTHQEALQNAKARRKAPVETGKTASAAPIVSEVQPDVNAGDYKKAGLTDAQVRTIAAPLNRLDKKKAEVEANTSLTTEQKTKSLLAIETERQAVLRKTMGESVYSNYRKISQQPAENSELTPAPAAN